MDTIDINEVKNKSKTGDLLLFNTRKHWYDFIIEYFSHSKFTHVGIIIRSDDISYNCNENNNYIDISTNLLFLESGHESLPDIIENKKIFGVQMVSFDKMINEYIKTNSGSIYYRQLECTRDISFSNTISSLIKSVYNKPYDTIPMDWIKSFFHLNNIGNTERTNTFWCSALVSYIYDKLGFIQSYNTKNSKTTYIPWTIIQPTQFSYYEMVKSSSPYKINFSKDIILHPELLITF